MNKKYFITSLAILFGVAPALCAEIKLNLQTPKSSNSSIEININRNKTNADIVKLITLDGMTSTENIKDISTGKNSFGTYILSGDDKFAQSNVSAAYSDYAKAIMASGDNDFQSLLAAYKLANIGFFTLSQQAMHHITDKNLYQKQSDAIKQIFFPAIALSYDEEIQLAELYTDIYYNNLSKETIKELSKQSNLLKKSDYANYVLAQAYFEAGEFNRALNSINKAINIKKNSPFYLQYKAKILCETKDYNTALKIINKISSLNLAAERFNQSLKAQKEFTLSNATKDTAVSKYHLAKYFLLIGEYNRALKEAANSIAAKRKNEKAYTLTGDIQTTTGEFTKAKESYNKALSVNKKYAPALKGMGNIEKMTGTYEDAISYYSQAQKYNKNDITTQIFLAELLYRTGDTLKAKEICASLTLKNADSSDLYYIMSEIYPENQQEYLRKAISLNAFNNDAWIDLAEANLLKNQTELAEKYLMYVRVSDQANYKYYYVEGLINKNIGKPQAAAVSFKKALKLNPNFTPAQKELNTLNL